MAGLRTPFILAVPSFPGNPYHDHTLAWSLAHTRLDTGVPIKTAVVDKGYSAGIITNPVPRYGFRRRCFDCLEDENA